MARDITFDIFARDRASQTLDKVGRSMSTTSSKFDRLAKVAAASAALAGAAVIKLGSDAIGKASDLGETLNKSNVIFGKQSAVMEAWAGTAANTMGLSKQKALEAAAGFGDMFSQLGFAGDKAAGMSKAVVQMSADLGSFNNLPTAEVADMMSAAFRGEYDSLQRLIPNINASRVETEALAKTGKKSAKELTAQEKAAATLAIVQKDGARAAGDFAKTSGSLSNQSKIATARLDDMQAKVGTKLIPAVTRATEVGLRMLTWMERNTGKVKLMAAGVGVLAGALAVAKAVTVAHSAALTVMAAKTAVFSAVSKTAAAVQWLFNAALTANPIGLVIVAIAALGAGLVLAYRKSETFRNVTKAALEAVGKAATWLWNSAFAPTIRFIVGGLARVMEFYATMLRGLSKVPGFGWAKTAANAMQTAADKANAIARGIKNIPAKKTVTVTVTTYQRTAGRIPVNGRQENVGQRAHGGPVRRGMPYIVGEREPELFVPDRNGTILNQQQIAAMQPRRTGAAAPAGDVYNININGPTIGDPEAVAKRIQAALLNLKRGNGGASLGLA